MVAALEESMENDEILQSMKAARPAMFALMSGEPHPGKDAMALAVEAFVEFEPNLDQHRSQVAGLIIAAVAAFKRENGEFVATAK